MSDPADLQASLNYQFKQPELLIRALTHRSHRKANNERLEFLGDSILGFVIAEALYHQFPDAPEGDLTRMRARLVREPTLASLARSLQFGEHILLGGGELRSGGFDRDSILADALEAVFGAIFLDAGFTTTRTIMLSITAESERWRASGPGLPQSMR